VNNTKKNHKLPEYALKALQEVKARLVKERESYGPLAVGQIWAVSREVTYPDGQKRRLRPSSVRPGMVLIANLNKDAGTNPYNLVRVFPVSAKWIFASPVDLAFEPEDSPLKNVGLMIECWNPKSMLRANLLAPVGKLDRAMSKDVRYLFHCVLHEKRPDQPLQSKGYIGPPIELKIDLRRKFRRDQMRATRFLSDPASALTPR
jgi:hypothetical protein